MTDLGSISKLTKIRTTPVLVSHQKQVWHSLKRVFFVFTVWLLVQLMLVKAS